jgi:hypothetical protein
VHHARVEFHIAALIRQAAVAHRVILRIEFDDVDARDHRIERIAAAAHHLDGFVDGGHAVPARNGDGRRAAARRCSGGARLLQTLDPRGLNSQRRRGERSDPHARGCLTQKLAATFISFHSLKHAPGARDDTRAKVCVVKFQLKSAGILANKFKTGNRNHNRGERFTTLSA